MAVLKGIRAIAKYLDVHPNTVQNWRHRHDLPMMLTPSRRILTTTTLIDNWIAARGYEQISHTKRRAKEQAAAADIER